MTAPNVDSVIDLDAVFNNLGGFGKYQKRRWVLFCLCLWSSAMVGFSYVFTTFNPEYRCLIPGCDNETAPEYKTEWINNASPLKNEKPDKCHRFISVATSDGVSNHTQCDANAFNSNRTEECHQFVFQSEHTSIVHDFEIFCDSKLWLLTLPGTVHFIGLFISLPITGMLADRFGRRYILIYGVFAIALITLGKSFSPKYWVFVLLEFIQPLAGSGIFTSIFVLGMELLEPENRILGGCIVFIFGGIGEASMGLIAMHTRTWQTLLRIVCIPSLLVFTYSWLIPESIRWLISQGRMDEANDILKKIAAENGVEVTEKTLLPITELKVNTNAISAENPKIPKKDYLYKVFKSRLMVIRFFACTFCWMSCAFIYYGLVLSSVAITGDRYWNFIMVALIEIPGNLCMYFACRTLGRRITLSGSLFIVGISCGAFIFITTGHWLQLVFYLIGKCCITTSFGTLYIFTAEMFPTPFRQTLMGLCSMLGRIGSILAPQMALLAIIWNALPLLTFSVVSILAGLMSLTFPETLNTKLPDTIEEARNIGKAKQENTKL